MSVRLAQILARAPLVIKSFRRLLAESLGDETREKPSYVVL